MQLETELNKINATLRPPTQVEKQETPSVIPPTPASPEVFNYDDYRKFLKDWLQWKKSVAPHYSGAIFAKRAGLNSHTILGMVIRKDRNLSSASSRAFIRALALSGREALYFEKLVLFNQADNPEDREYYLDQLLSISRGNGQKLLTKLRNHTQCLSHWYIVAIRALVDCEGFEPDPAWISQKLKKKITRKEAEAALNILLEAGLVARDPDTGAYREVDPCIDYDPGIIDFAVRNFHKEFLKRTEDAISHEPLDERELSSLTLSVSEEGLAVLRNRIKEFRKQMNQELASISTQSKKVKVVALNTQLLVLTE